MNDKDYILSGVSQIFSHRESFIVIALTGRTGSGCSTVANLLTSENISKIEFPVIPNNNIKHDDRTNRIITTWIAENWHPFTKIQVSQIILLLLLASDTSEALSAITKYNAIIEVGQLKAIFEQHYQASKRALDTLSDIKSANKDAIEQSFTFILNELPDISSSIKSIINSKEKLYTGLFQLFGDNIRLSGSPLLDTINPNNLLTLPGLISRLIKLARHHNRINNITKNYYVIDALRHPYEIRYLKERISPFYCMAISTSDFHRIARLSDLNFRKEEIEGLDAKEYPTEAAKPKKQKTGEYADFVSQNIQSCLGISDIYIRNDGPPENRSDLRDLSLQVCKYVSLMQHPGLVTPSNLERCMQIAFTSKLNSNCISRQVGAVVTDENFSIKSVGWNDVPQGQVPCLLRNVYHLLTRQDQGAYSAYELSEPFIKKIKGTAAGKLSSENYKGRNLSYCFKSNYNELKNEKNQVHTRSLHAEENAFLQTSKYGGPGLQGGNLFTTASPCELCSKKAYQLGIKNIYYIDPYPGISKEHILTSGDSMPNVVLFSGAIGKAYHELYQPIMPYKDELECFISN